MKNKILKSLFLSIFLASTYSICVQASPTEYIVGKDRYETAAMISDRLNYSTAIIVNGLSIADGLSASGLSGSLNAPILLTTANSLPSSTMKT